MNSELRRLVALALLAAFAGHHWFMLVDGSEAWRWLACVAIGCAGAVALLFLRTRRLLLAVAGAGLVFLGMLALGLVASGVPAELLFPGGWDELSDQLSRGLAGVGEVKTPYSGEDRWTSLGILAVTPLAVAIAMTAAFWPVGRSRIARGAGLAALLALYGLAVTWEAPSGEVMRGALLFVLVAAVLWLPRLPLARAATALAALILALAVSLPISSRMSSAEPLIDYAEWGLLGTEKRISFNWSHTYGKLDWPQEGTEVFSVTAELPAYWKTYVLDRFDGDNWDRSSDDFGDAPDELALAGAPAAIVDSHPEWVRRFEVHMAALRSRLAVTAGTPLELDGLDVLSASGDGTVTADGTEIPASTDYEFTAYIPDPSPRRLRRAEGAYIPGTERYTTLFLQEERSVFERSIGSPPPVTQTIVSPAGVEPEPGEPRVRERDLPLGVRPIDDVVEGTQFEQILALTRRIVDGASSDYEAVARIQRFLVSNYEYDQNVALTENPLPSFVLRKRKGYCQHFAGAMGLMLRMVGIPSRVVSGFAPGVPLASRSYTVTDTDAHSWVEVLFPGIGWVTVDPTPGQSPAHTVVPAPGGEAETLGLDIALGRPLGDADRVGRRSRELEPQASTPTEDDGSSLVPFLVVLAAGVGASALVVHRRRRLRSPAGADLQLRELADALRATGRDPRPGTTLMAIQAELSSTVGPAAARYAAGLRESRYGRRTRKRPGPGERRSFRAALARRSGRLGWWKALRAVPLGGPRG